MCVTRDEGEDEDEKRSEEEEEETRGTARRCPRKTRTPHKGCGEKNVSGGLGGGGP